MGLGIGVKVNGVDDGDLAGAQEIEVYERVGEPTTFRLRFPLVVRDGDVPLLSDARLDPGTELSIVIPSGGEDVYLAKGPVTGHRSHIEHGMVESWLDVLGADVSIEMDREVNAHVWADVTASDVVNTLVSKHGWTPDIDPTPSRSIEDKHTLVQRDTDLRFVRRLARRYGFSFWTSPDATGTPVAHFKRPSLEGAPTTSLQINLDGSNVGVVNLQFDVEHPTSATALQLDLNDKTEIDGAVAQTPLALLGDNGLGAITGDTRTVQVVAAVDDADDLKGRGEGALIDEGWFIRATCETSVRAIGAVVRPNTVVDLQGLGKRHSGKYWVYGVRHSIDASAHTMEIELYRNAWGT